MTFREVLMKLLSKYLTEDEMKRLETNEMTSEEFQKIMTERRPEKVTSEKVTLEVDEMRFEKIEDENE